ncbi:hypothetical protein P2318_14215 [Myxococcaceae bacterium GXIMD 01537]
MKGWLQGLLVAGTLLGAGAASAATVYDSSLRFMVEERYDDDLRLSDGLAGGQFMTKFTPRLMGEAKNARLTAEGFYAADLLVRHGSGNVSLDHRAGLETRYLLSRRLRVDVTGRVYRVTDPTSLPRQGLARSTTPTLYGQARLTLLGRVTSRLDVRATYAFEGARMYQSGLAPSYVHTPSAELLYRGTRRLTLGLEYRYQGFVFANEYSDAHAAIGSLRYRLSRVTTLTVRGGPVFFRQPTALGGSGVVPRVALELARDGQFVDWGFVVGHDLVGASGFTDALWADYASLMATRRFSARLSLTGAASYFRNGLAPGEDFFEARGERLAQGYAVGLGLEYRWTRRLSMQGALDRIAQVGAVGTGVDLTRNVAAVRFIYTAW